MSFLFSIVTPCYRGKSFLARAFQSLTHQRGNHRFEWIIVDDFSNDNGQTKDVIQAIKKDSSFPIIPIFLKQNYFGSKSTYTGAKIARGEYTIILDQDDMLADDALDVFSSYIREYDEVIGFAGVCGRCKQMNGKFIGTPFPWRENISNELHIRHIDKIRGEMFQCTKTSIIVKYFKGMKPGYTNGWAWNQIARMYQYLYTSKVVRIYDTGNPDSTSNRKQMVYLDAQFETLTQYLVANSDYLRHDSWFTLRLLLQWGRTGSHLKMNFKDLLISLPQGYHRQLKMVYPLVMIKYFRDRLSGK